MASSEPSFEARQDLLHNYVKTPVYVVAIDCAMSVLDIPSLCLSVSFLQQPQVQTRIEQTVNMVDAEASYQSLLGQS